MIVRIATLMFAALLATVTAGSATPCCSQAENGSSCVNAAGRPEIPAGCIEDEASASCAGGSVDPRVGRGGCLCVRGRCQAEGSDVTARECARSAAAACCAAGQGRGCE
jgi:hypothetical protein